MVFLAAPLRREREEFAGSGRCEPVAAPAPRVALTSPRDAVQHRSDDLKCRFHTRNSFDKVVPQSNE
jgi:hypothetical protein